MEKAILRSTYSNIGAETNIQKDVKNKDLF